jgi:NADH dehydrogenase [ubiquinone] 1 alpha subcomplex assembly factor 6
MQHNQLQTLITDVRAGDYDRFLAIQLAPPAARAGLYAITAFHIELARIAEIVSEPLIGHIRLTWWREALEEIEAAKTPRNHPVVLALATLHPTHPEIFMWLHRAIAARAADVDTSLIAQESAWVDYCDNTAGALHMAWALLLGVSEAHHETVRMQGRAYAFVGLARAIPYMHHQGWLRFAHARMNAAAITTLESSEGLKIFCKSLIANARAMMEDGEGKALPKALRALLHLTRLHIHEFESAQFDPYRLKPSKLAAVWQVTRLYIT